MHMMLKMLTYAYYVISTALTLFKIAIDSIHITIIVETIDFKTSSIELGTKAYK